MQNGNHDLISNFNKDVIIHTLQIKNTSDEDYLEILSLNINICKTGSHNPLENVPFYDYRTNMHCTISQNQFNIYFPSKETLSYIFKKEHKHVVLFNLFLIIYKYESSFIHKLRITPS